MHVTFGSKRGRVAAAILAAMLLVSTAAPAGADAAPPRDITRFACPPNSPNPFTDITGSTHEEAIRCAVAYGFVNGTSSTTFSPDAPLTRGQAASFLARGVTFAGLQLDTSDRGFTDIAGSVHREAINGLAAIGVINGTSATTFSPDQPVSRAQVAALVARLIGPAGSPQLPDGPDAFNDDNGSEHEQDINALAAAGIVAGVTSTEYDPSGTLTRAESASILARVQDFAVEHLLSFPVGDAHIVRAALTGANEVPGPGDPKGQSTVELVKTSVAGLLCLTFDIDQGLSSAATAAHVHQAAAGSAGPIVLTLPTPAAAPDTPMQHSECVPGLDQSAIDAVFANPSGFYVNIHTEALPNGAVRGQLTGIASSLATPLSGDEEVPGPGEDGGTGFSFIDAMADGTTICSFLFYAGSGTPTAAHIHKAAAGSAGPIAVTLPPFIDGGPGSDGCIGGLAPALVADIVAHPDQYYVNIHTDAFPNGAVRGQLETLVALSTTLSGGAEVPGPGDPDGAGDVLVELQGGNSLCVAVHVRGTDKPTAAHVHQGATGVAGPVVVTLPTPTFNTSRGCVDIDPALYASIAANPAAFYVNVHTEAFPSGALRGQLAVQSLQRMSRFQTRSALTPAP